MGILAFARRHLPAQLKRAIRRALGPRLNAPPASAMPAAPYESDLCEAIEAIVKPGWICVDVGAHTGVITEMLAGWVGPSGHVFAFEAHPGNAEALSADLDAKALMNRVTVENLAISDGASDSLWLFAGRMGHSTEWNILGEDVDGVPTQREVEVPATSLDDYFTDEVQPDFVKIDVEGAEADVLAGMRRLLRESRPALAIEFHHEKGWDGRHELFAADYDLYETGGRRLDRHRDTNRLYHCIALPGGSPLESILGGARKQATSLS